MADKSVILKQEEQENIAKNLNYLIATQHLSANQIAAKLALPLVTIRRLMLGDTTDPRISTIKSIADYFNVSLDSLITHDLSQDQVKHSPVKPCFVPILTWQELTEVTNFKEINLTNPKEWLPLPIDASQKLSEYAFALESRPSMIPRFSNGTIFVFDPELPVKDSDLALIKFSESGEISLREIIIDPPCWKLLPVVPTSEAMTFDETNHQIMGIVLLTLFYNRRVK